MTTRIDSVSSSFLLLIFEKKYLRNINQNITDNPPSNISYMYYFVEATQAKAEGQKLSAEVNHWKSRCDTVITQCESEKQVRNKGF